MDGDGDGLVELLRGQLRDPVGLEVLSTLNVIGTTHHLEDIDI